MKKMKALVMKNVSEIELEEIEIPNYKDNEVLIRVKACGICGSDLPRALDGGVHSFPIVLGHEFSGEVDKIGNNVKNIKVGDRVTAAPLLPCGKCVYCKVGKPSMCQSYGFLGSRENGAMAEYIAIKEENVIKLPEEVDFLSGAMIEPITVAIHGIERVKIVAGESVFIFGAGTIGLLVLQCLKAIGAGKIYVVDVVDDKLQLAKKLGADEVINSLKVDILKYLNENGKPSAVFETSGSSIAQKQCLDVVDKLGKIVYIGTSTRDVNIPPKSFESILRGEINITGSWMSYSAPFPGYEWDTAVRFIKEGKINPKELITNTYKLEAGINAFKIMRDKTQLTVKVMFEI
jgi:L-iditol 2-dehydrogenase/galactitol-1-phosphate 5-dehydrogenase